MKCPTLMLLFINTYFTLQTKEFSLLEDLQLRIKIYEYQFDQSNHIHTKMHIYRHVHNNQE